MFTGRVPFNDFVFSMLLICAGMWVAVAVPFHIYLGWSFFGVLASAVLVFGLVSVWVYRFYFVLSLTPLHFLGQGLFFILLFSVFAIQPDFLLYQFGNESHKPVHWYEFIGVIYSLFVLVTGFIWGWLCSRTDSKASMPQNDGTWCWLTSDVNLQDRTFLSPTGMGRLKNFLCFLLVVAALLIFILIIPSLDFDTQGVKYLIIRVASMLLTLILYGALAVSISEALRLIQLQTTDDKGVFHLYDFDERLKWRHDYVKYHLPAPIRQMNLRVFAQHVEAYERFKREARASNN